MRLERIAAVAMLAVSASLVLAACGGDYGDDSTSTNATGGNSAGTTQGKEKPTAKPAIETIAIRNGVPVGGVQELEYGSGEQVQFRVRSDAADEVHVHGYDLSKDVAAGGAVSFSFPADIEGIFEVELEERGEQIAELRVNP
jgi:hypothetical protein